MLGQQAGDAPLQVFHYLWEVHSYLTLAGQKAKTREGAR